MKKYYTTFRQSGDFIEEFDTLEEAKKAIDEYEEQDKKEGIFEPNFYEVEDKEHNTIYADYEIDGIGKLSWIDESNQ